MKTLSCQELAGSVLRGSVAIARYMPARDVPPLVPLEFLEADIHTITADEVGETLNLLLSLLTDSQVHELALMLAQRSEAIDDARLSSDKEALIKQRDEQRTRRQLLAARFSHRLAIDEGLYRRWSRYWSHA